MDFIIDTEGQVDLLNKDKLLDDDDDVEFGQIDLDITKIIKRKDNEIQKKKKVDPNDIDLEEFEQDMGWKKSKCKSHIDKDVKKIMGEIAPLQNTLKKSVIKPGFERIKRVPGYDTSERKLKASRKGQRNSTKGKDWFNLPATEKTAEIRHDLEIIKMRSVLDPKHFYKKNDMKTLPKYFHVGKVVDSPLDYYSSRLTKKERKSTIVDELLADAQFAKYNKRKYKEIIDEKRKTQYKAYRHAKRLKRKKKNK